MSYLYEVLIPANFEPHFIVLGDGNVTSISYKRIYKNHMGHYNNGYSMCYHDNEQIVWACAGKAINKTRDFCHYHNMSKEDILFYTLVYGDRLPVLRADVHPNHDTLSTLTTHRILYTTIISNKNHNQPWSPRP